MKTKFWLSVAPVIGGGLIVLATAVQAPAAPQAPDPENLFKERCALCHDPAVDRAPGKEAMAQRPPADLIHVMTDGAMAPMAGGMSKAEIESLAIWLGAKSAAPAAPATAAPPSTTPEAPATAPTPPATPAP